MCYSFKGVFFLWSLSKWKWLDASAPKRELDDLKASKLKMIRGSEWV